MPILICYLLIFIEDTLKHGISRTFLLFFFFQPRTQSATTAIKSFSKAQKHPLAFGSEQLSPISEPVSSAQQKPTSNSPTAPTTSTLAASFTRRDSGNNSDRLPVRAQSAYTLAHIRHCPSDGTLASKFCRISDSNSAWAKLLGLPPWQVILFSFSYPFICYRQLFKLRRQITP